MTDSFEGSAAWAGANASGGSCHFDPTPSQVSAERILRIQGYVQPQSVRPAIAQAATRMAQRALTLCRAEVAFRHVRVQGIDEQGLDVDGGVRLNSPAFASRLAGCDEVVAFVLSCGTALDQMVVELADAGDLLEAVLLESAGWLCIEDVTRQFKLGLKQSSAMKGRRITSRMGPGYSYAVDDREVSWPLEDHPNLFALLEGCSLPASLMASCAMNPKHSRSGLYGIAPLQDFQVGRPDTSN